MATGSGKGNLAVAVEPASEWEWLVGSRAITVDLLWSVTLGGRGDSVRRVVERLRAPSPAPPPSLGPGSRARAALLAPTVGGAPYSRPAPPPEAPRGPSPCPVRVHLAGGDASADGPRSGAGPRRPPRSSCDDRSPCSRGEPPAAAVRAHRRRGLPRPPRPGAPPHGPDSGRPARAAGDARGHRRRVARREGRVRGDAAARGPGREGPPRRREAPPRTVRHVYDPARPRGRPSVRHAARCPRPAARELRVRRLRPQFAGTVQARPRGARGARQAPSRVRGGAAEPRSRGRGAAMDLESPPPAHGRGRLDRRAAAGGGGGGARGGGGGAAGGGGGGRASGRACSAPRRASPGRWRCDPGRGPTRRGARRCSRRSSGRGVALRGPWGERTPSRPCGPWSRTTDGASPRVTTTRPGCAGRWRRCGDSGARCMRINARGSSGS